MPEPSPTDAPAAIRTKRGLVRSYPGRCIWIYIVLVIISNLFDWYIDESRSGWSDYYIDARNGRTYEVDTTGLPVKLNPLPYRVATEGDPNSTLPPVLLIHGSPGGASGFDTFAPALAADGRRVFSLDLPGFGTQNEPWSRGSVFEDYGSDTYAAILWRLLESMGDEERVHLVGWSNGGAVGLRMIEQHPERVASLTLLAAVGAQVNEGTGSYAFEHFKYKVGRMVLDYGSHFYPHFGLLGPMGERNAFLRYFDDTDQRDLGALMESIDTPTMIMHGRGDFLIPVRAAEDHYQRMPSARLVMMDAMHFIPMMDGEYEIAASYLIPFFARHDMPGVAPLTDEIDLAPVPDRQGADAFVRIVGMGLRSMPWWAGLAIFIILIRLRPFLGIALALLFVTLLDIDFGVALLSMFIGWTWWLVRGADELDRPWTVLGWVRGFLYVLPAFVIGVLGGSLTLMLTDRLDSLSEQLKDTTRLPGTWLDWLGLFIGMWCTCVALRFFRLVVTREGRARLHGAYLRLTNHEYYPSGVLYLTTLIAAFERVLAGKGLRSLTAVNPGYSHDGGLREERKSELDSRFPDDPCVLRSVLIEPAASTQARADHASHLVEATPSLGGYPIIAKPDQGARGEGVRVIRTANEMLQYCVDHREPFVLQRYHPGPIEVGILWIRHADTIAEPKPTSGFIYAINRKHFPEVVGDGNRSLRQLILNHRRHRAQARMFISRLRDQQHLIPLKGERVPIGTFGNHAQGAMFTDGEDLITPELGARIDKIASGFRDADGNGFDIGRFDVRSTSYESLMRGEELGIVELNGLTSEPTNIYDPDRSIIWAWRTMLGYWRHVEQLAEARITQGSGEPITKREARALVGEFLRAMRR